MRAGACQLAVALVALLVALPTGRVVAQADDHAHPVARATCQNGKQSEAVTQAAAALDRDPEDLGPRMRLADALVDQGCYQEAVAVLEAAQQGHPHSGELAAKLRDVRSLVTEQTYIEGLTQAAETAKFQRNQLRCLRLADITACDDALKFKPDDEPLLVAKGDALVQGSRLVAAVEAYQRAAELKPADEGLKDKLAATQALKDNLAAAGALKANATPAGEAAQVAVANTAAQPKAPKRVRQAATNLAGEAAANSTSGPPAAANGPTALAAATARPRAGAGAPPAIASVASLEPQATRTYSNDAPPGQTN